MFHHIPLDFIICFSLRFTYQTFSCCFITLDGLLRFSNEGSFTFSGFLSFSPSFFSPSFFSDASLFFSSYATKYHNNVLTNFQKKKHKWIHLEEILWRQRKWRDFLKSCDLLAIQELDYASTWLMVNMCSDKFRLVSNPSLSSYGVHNPTEQNPVLESRNITICCSNAIRLLISTMVA